MMQRIGMALLIMVSLSFSNTNSLQAIQVQKGPKVDGKLDDAVWSQATATSDLRMVEPQADSEPSERTIVRIMFDTDALYIGIDCFDSQPEKIIGNTLSHDAFGEDSGGDDVIRVLLDPIQDGRNAFIFMVNPRGARSEGFALGEHYSLNWDGIWDAKCRIHKKGWSAELEIPFKTLLFNPDLQSWGINIERYISRKMETIRFSGPTPDNYFSNPTEAGRLLGIQQVKQGRGITFRPYGVVRENRPVFTKRQVDWQQDGGFDLYRYFTPNFAGAFSYHTDFAETEVDARRINITRFPLLFPEKRAFFLEGSNIFEFGAAGDSFYPFFSRTMGLYQGKPLAIQYGAKVFGKIGNTNIAMVEVHTESSPAQNLASQHLFAGRISQNIWTQSRMGIIATVGDPTGRNRNALMGADFRYATARFHGNRNLSVDTWYLYNWNSLSSGSHDVYGIKIDYPNDLIDSAFRYNRFGDSLEPGLGYVRRTGVQNVMLVMDVMPRPRNGWLSRVVRQFFFQSSGTLYWDLKNSLETAEYFLAPVNFLTQNGHHMEFNATATRDVLKEPFEVADGVIIPVGRHDYLSYGLEYSTPSFFSVTMNCEYRFGEYYTGRYRNSEVELILKYHGHVNVALNAEFVHGDLTQGSFNENVYQLKCDLYFSPRLGLMNYLQYDDVTRLLGANIRFKWELTPGNMIYLVYNKNWEKRFDPRSRFLPLQERAVFKVQFCFRP